MMPCEKNYEVGRRAVAAAERALAHLDDHREKHRHAVNLFEEIWPGRPAADLYFAAGVVIQMLGEGCLLDRIQEGVLTPGEN